MTKKEVKKMYIEKYRFIKIVNITRPVNDLIARTKLFTKIIVLYRETTAFPLRHLDASHVADFPCQTGAELESQHDTWLTGCKLCCIYYGDSNKQFVHIAN